MKQPIPSASPIQEKSEPSVRPKYTVPALEKALDVLELLSEQAVPMTQAQLCRALEREPSELFRTLCALEGRGYLRREGDGAYVLTLKLFELSRTHSPHEQLLRAASTPMRELVERCRESCHLCVLHRDQVLVLAQVDAPTSIRLSVEAGSLHSPVGTVSGQVLLAHSPEFEREDVLSRRADYLRMSAGERRAFQDALATVRDNGWAYAEGARFVGGRDLSVPVGAATARTQAVLTIASLRGTHTAHEDLFDFLPVLRQCAADISRLAGID
ncbi:MAG: IclR family transcriptional regulator [Hymenobacter sp.]|nr:IclR family transcriptional regulator [Hymenobacter sp.]